MKPLSEIADRSFDVAVIGAGVNGSSAAQNLAAAGYSVLIFDKKDFAAGSSSRSSRLLHCGLRYLAPGSSALEFVRHPTRFATACRMAKQAMASRSQFVKNTPERVRQIQFNFPIYDDTPYSGWQIDSAFALLYALGPKDVPLDYKRLKANEITHTPLVRELRDQKRLKSVAAFREYRFDWPERVVIDTILDAERMGAVVRNYTSITGLERETEKWKITLENQIETESSVTVHADVVLNMAGIWIDEVNSLSKTGQPKRRITGTKGTHFAVRFPPECAKTGWVTLNRKKEPFYCIPWRGLHYIGPTETLYESGLEEIRPTEDEVAWLIDEANYLMPSFNISREDVIYAWAGVRPLTYNPLLPMGARSREVHDLGTDGLPNVFAMTAGPVMSHRSAGEEITEAVKKKLAPSGRPQKISFNTFPLPSDPNSPPLVEGDDSVRLADIQRAAAEEHAQTLIDTLFRRTGAGWSSTMALGALRAAANTMSKVHGWDEARIAEEIDRYREYVRDQHLHRDLEVETADRMASL